MATTVTTATLKVDITETITLNGTTYDKTTTQSITGIAQYTSRVYQLKASTTHTVVEFASDPSNNVFDSDDFKYMRITNLDDTNAINLTFAEESTVGCAFQLDAGESFIICSTI